MPGSFHSAGQRARILRGPWPDGVSSQPYSLDQLQNPPFRQSSYGYGGRSRSGPVTPLAGQVAEREAEGLPVKRALPRIVESFESNDITILEAGTGSGKTTEVPWALAQRGYRVHVSQPRRFAASSVATYMDRKFGGADGELIGFKHAYGERCGPNARVTFYTEGYLLKKILHANPGDFTERDIILYDESHEGTTYMEALFAVHKKRLGCKLGIMTATLDESSTASAVASYFGKTVGHIRVAGRHRSITELPAGPDMVTDIVAQVAQGRNILVFLPGKGEIAAMRRKLEEIRLDAEILPLHGRLSAREQDMVHETYGRPKVVLATNLAQTSVTLNGMHVVILSGYERRLTVQDGMEVLAILPITLSSFTQQVGRVGRTEAGFFINHGPPKESLQKTNAWQIQNTLLDDMVLRLIQGGEHPHHLDFFHKPKPGALDRAVQNLKRLKLLGSAGYPTPKGRLVAELPLEIRAGKMLVSAQIEISKLPDRGQRDKMMNAAILLAAISDSDELRATVPKQGQPSSDGLGTRKRRHGRGGRVSTGWNRLCEDLGAKEVVSDLIVEMYAFYKVISVPERERSKIASAFGIDLAAFNSVQEKRLVLADRMGVTPETPDVRKLSFQETMILLESIWFGWSDSAFEMVRSVGGGRATYRPVFSDRGRVRNLSRNSSISSASLVVGEPFDLMTDVDQRDSIVRILGRVTHLHYDWLRVNRYAGDRQDAHEAVKLERKRQREHRRDSSRDDV
jgi:hypothetical protein